MKVVHMPQELTEEEAHCHAVTCEAAAKNFLLAASKSLSIGMAATLVLRERQAAREPLEARVRELERQLADVLESALQPESFDPQAVRELLAQIAKDTGTVGSAHFVREAAQRVRESEKKQGGE